MTAKIGDNNPPSEFEMVRDEINDLFVEAKGFLDGDPIDNQGVADSVDLLVKMIKKASKTAEALRVAEVAPLDSAKRAIQDKYAPLTAKTKGCTGKAVLALEACNDALTPWKQKLQQIKDDEARAAAQEAEEKLRKAQEASKAVSLEEREKAQELQTEAVKAMKTAKRASKETVKGMRTVYKVQMVHPKEAFTHYWNTRRQEILDVIQGFAEQEACEAVQKLPGFKITKEKVAK